MKSRSTPHSKPTQTLLLALTLVVGTTFYRILAATWLTALPNFSPVMAMAFCCGLFLPGVLAAVLPVACLLFADLVLNAYFAQPLVTSGTLVSSACTLFAIGSGVLMRNRGSLGIFAVVATNTVVFYLVTNSVSWLGNPHYAQSAAGWIQALTVGLPGFPPTWVFFRNALAGDLLFTTAFLAAFAWIARSRPTLPVPNPAE